MLVKQFSKETKKRVQWEDETMKMDEISNIINMLWYFVLAERSNPTNPFTILELKNPWHDVSELNKIR